MKEFVKVEIARIENVVLFKILEQDDSAIERGKFNTMIDGVKVTSGNYPDVGIVCGGTKKESKLYLLSLRGIEGKLDNVFSARTLNTCEEAKLICMEIRNTIDKLNEKLNKKPQSENPNKIEAIYY